MNQKLQRHLLYTIAFDFAELSILASEIIYEDLRSMLFQRLSMNCFSHFLISKAEFVTLYHTKMFTYYTNFICTMGDIKENARKDGSVYIG